MVVSSSLSRESTPSCTQEYVQSYDSQLPEPDTPTRARITDNPEFQCFYVKSQREALVEYLGGEVCWSSVEYFFKNVLPQVRPQLDVERIYKHCIRKKKLKKCGRRGSYVWSDFPENPEDSSIHEATVFKSLAGIFELITDAAKSTQGKRSSCPAPTTHLHVDGNKATWSEKKSDLKPDAHVYLNEHNLGYPVGTEDRHWYNSVFVLEFKKNSNEEARVSHIFFSVTTILNLSHIP